MIGGLFFSVFLSIVSNSVFQRGLFTLWQEEYLKYILYLGKKYQIPKEMIEKLISQIDSSFNESGLENIDTQFFEIVWTCNENM